jgi:hypothetical protein
MILFARFIIQNVVSFTLGLVKWLIRSKPASESTGETKTLHPGPMPLLFFAHEQSYVLRLLGIEQKFFRQFLRAHPAKFVAAAVDN